MQTFWIFLFQLGVILAMNESEHCWINFLGLLFSLISAINFEGGEKDES